MKKLLSIASLFIVSTSAAEFTVTDSENLQSLYSTTESIYYDVNSYIVNLESLGSTVQWDQETWDAWMNVHDKELFEMVKTFTDSYFSSWQEKLDPLFENVETSASELSALSLNTYTIQEILYEVTGYLTALNSLRFSGSDLKVHDEKAYEELKQIKGSLGSLNDSFNSYSSEVGHYHEGAINLLNTINDSINANSGGGSGTHGLTLEEFNQSMGENNVFDLFNKIYNFNDTLSLSETQWNEQTDTDPQSETAYETYSNSRSITGDGFLEFFANWLKDISLGRANDTKSLILIAKSLRPENHDDDKEEIENQIQEIQSKEGELSENFSQMQSELNESVNGSMSQNFAIQDSFRFSIDNVIGPRDLPNTIYLGSLPYSHILGIDISGIKNIYIDTEKLYPFVDVSRKCSIVMLYLTLLGFIIFVLRVAAPMLDKIKDLILTALQLKS